MSARREALLVGAIAFLTRLPWLPRVEQDLDGSRFVRALMRFDLAQGHPHPPGYPLLVALASIVMRATRSPALSLSLVSAASFALTVSVTYALAHRATRARSSSLFAAALFATGTLATVQSARPLSDMLGCALAWSALVLDESRAASYGALVGAVACARLSALPIVALDALRRARRDPKRVALTALACALVVDALYAPVIASVGARRFVTFVTEHAEGHFTRFGGSVVTRPDLGERARAFAFGLHAQVMGGAWSDRARSLVPSSLALWALTLAGASRRTCRPLFASCAVYALWVFFGQNVVWQPRHLLPLAPAFALLGALGFDALRLRSRRVAIVCAVIALAPASLESMRLLRAQAREEPPTLRLAEAIDRRCDPSRTIVATAQLGTWLRYRASRHRVVEVSDVDEALALARRNGVGLCVTSEVEGVASRGLRRVARVVGDRYVTTTLYDLALWMSP